MAPNKKITSGLKKASSYILKIPLNKTIWPKNKDLRFLRHEIAQTEKAFPPPKKKNLPVKQRIKIPPPHTENIPQKTKFAPEI